MKNILLATTALVMTAGAASAEMTWTGTVTAGIARQGSIDAVAAATATSQGFKQNIADGTSSGGQSTLASIGSAHLGTASQITLDAASIAEKLALVQSALDVLAGAAGASIATLSTSGAIHLGAQVGGTISQPAITSQYVVGNTLSVTATTNAVLTVEKTALLALAAQNKINAIARGLFDGTTAVVAEDYKTYSEVNLTGAASVTTDSGLTFKTAISVDGGMGYDLADDDKFDTVKPNGRNGGSVGLDYISVGGAFGTITIDENEIAHLVDGDDNATGDISYKGTFGDVTVQAVFDQDKDTNNVAVASGLAWDATTNQFTYAANQGTASDKGNGVDTAWSAAISGAVQGVSYRYATDEEGGYAGSLGYTMSGVTLGLSTKLEAWEKDLNKPVHNGVSVAYAVEGLSLNGAWDSVKDGNQTSWGVGYTGGDATVGFNTNEKNEWTATASLALGAGASLNAGVNYTDDAQVGVSFSF